MQAEVGGQLTAELQARVLSPPQGIPQHLLDGIPAEGQIHQP